MKMSTSNSFIGALSEVNSLTDYLNMDWTNQLPSATTTTVFYFVLISVLLLKYKRQNELMREESIKRIHENNLRIIPSPPRMPIIGNMHMMRDYQENPWDGFNVIRNHFGDIVSLQMGVHPMILVSKIEYIREVLLDKGTNFANRPHFPRYDIIFGGDKEHSLALCNWSNVHRARRKFCKRGVVPSKISDRNRLLERIISEHSIGLVAILKNRSQVNAGGTNLTKSDILFLTGDIFMRFLSNEKYSHADELYQKFNWNCDYIFYDINKCLLIDFLPYLIKLGVGRSYLRELKEITDYCRCFIDNKIFEPRYLKHKQDFELKKARGEELESEDSHDYLDQIILEHLSGSTVMSLEDYKVGFADLLAGHSAVSNILMKLLGHLALDRAAQDMLYEEAIKTKSSSSGESRSLPVAEAALLEALRFASSPIVPHIAREDTSIGEYFVPKGSAILFNTYHINMSDEYWAEPRKFNIKRFLDERVDDATGEKIFKLNCPKFFNPFSVGLRQCLGFRMVESISTAAASTICETFIIKADDESLVRRLLEPRGTVALSPLERCYGLQLTPRIMQT